MGGLAFFLLRSFVFFLVLFTFYLFFIFIVFFICFFIFTKKKKKTNKLPRYNIPPLGPTSVCGFFFNKGGRGNRPRLLSPRLSTAGWEGGMERARKWGAPVDG